MLLLLYGKFYIPVVWVCTMYLIKRVFRIYNRMRIALKKIKKENSTLYFQDILEEALVCPLNVEGELYIGIPPGVESRVATVTYDQTDFSRFAAMSTIIKDTPYAAMPSSLLPDIIASLIQLCNSLDDQRAIMPAGNGNISARALARYYAALVDGGIVPSQHSSSFPPLGSHHHRPKSSNPKSDPDITSLETGDTIEEPDTKIFHNPKSTIHEAFLGTGDYKDLVLPDGKFGLGFRRIKTTEGSVIGFGHAGLGGSTGCAGSWDLNAKPVIN
ncbi:hypothetical protein L1887_27686 [Cichorium endivia]|nr:hypothetical protein L1887_27686 [Cichorium endivia]